MTIITMTLRLLDHTIVEFTIDATGELITDTEDDDPETVVVNDANIINWDNEPEP